MTEDWFFSRRWLALKFALILCAGISFHIVAVNELEVQQEKLATRNFDSPRLESLSRLEIEFHQIFEKGRAYVAGRAPIEDVKLALDIFWSRIGTYGDPGRLQMYADEGVDVALLGSVREDLPAIDAAVQELRTHDQKSMASLDAFHDRHVDAIDQFSDAAYAARVRVIQENSTAKVNLFDALRRYELMFTLYGAGLFIFLLAEVAWANSASKNLRRSAEANQRLANTDPLTGLYNRRFLDEELTRRKAKSNGGRPLSAIAIDIDGFQTVNDSLGHAIGDQMLVEVARRIEAVSNGAIVTRVSSDEYITLVEAGSPGALYLAERIRGAVSQPINLGDRPYSPSVSIAVVDNVDTKTPGETIQAANAAMREAKAKGGGHVIQFQDIMLRPIRERNVIDADLTEAIRQDGIHIVVQPKVTLADRNVHGFEALARWQHPQLGWVSPETFCNIADATGRSATLGLKIADLAFEFTAAARRAGQDGRMSINVSPAFGSHPTFVADMCGLINKHGLAASDVEFEVTEEAMLSGASAVRDNMMAMRALGSAVSIDDFGKGHSNISRLTKLAVSVIKVDKTVIGEGVDIRSSRAIIKGLVELARELEIELLVEGVETEDQVRTLMELGVMTAQGYLFSRPLPPLKLLTWLAEQKQAQEDRSHSLAVA